MESVQANLFGEVYNRGNIEKNMEKNERKSCFGSANVPNMEYNSCGEKQRWSVVDYISARDAAKAWGVSVRRVSTLCSANKTTYSKA